MKNKKLIIPLAALALLGGAVTGVAVSASAQTTSGTATTPSNKPYMSHGVAGTIASINGNTIALTGKNGATYEVDASKATISEISTINVSGLSVGDTLMVGGTVNGSSVAATHIVSGTMPMASGGSGWQGKGQGTGNRGPGVRGTVTAVNGNSLTVTGKNGTAYTVDAANAKVMKSVSGSTTPSTITVSNIAVGDTVSIRGTVSGSSVTATSVFDGIPPARAPNSGATTTK